MTPSPNRSARSRIRSVALAVMLVLMSTAATLGVMEIVLRISSGAYSTTSFREILVNDPVMGYRPRPGARARMVTSEYDTEIRINEAGVRDDRELPLKRPDERRIVVLGDSMVMAVQVETDLTFVARLERRLSEAGPGSLRVINAGVQGYGPVEEYLFLAHRVLSFEPDLILIVVHAGNDATDAAGAERLLARETGDAAERTSQLPPSSNGRFGLPLWIRRLARRSAAVQFVRMRVLRILGPSSETPVRDRPIDAYLVAPPRDVTRGFAVAREALAQIVALARANGVGIGVVVLPASFEVDKGRFDELEREYAGRGRLDRHAASRRFDQLVASLDQPCVNVLAAFQAEPDPAALYFAGNSHLTPLGHEVTARVIASFIDRERLLDRAGAPQ